LSEGGSSALATIDAVIFDVGNVLIRWDMYNLYRRIFADDARIAAFLAETGLVTENVKFDAGAPYTAGTRALADRFPHHAEAILAFDQRWADCLDGAIDDNVAVLRDLQRAGTPTHAITNFSAEKFPIACRLFPFLTTFDETVVSGAVRMVKPDPRIYRLLLDKCGLEPSRAVFIDDSAANIATARALGLNAIRFVEGVNLRLSLREMGVAGL
jgi:2-haloacid dehalogenase